MKYFVLVLLSLACLGISKLAAQNEDPNILLIIADDLGIDALNGFQQSNRSANTPHLDELRTNGLTFTNTWATPQCTPTRASIMSGKYGIKTGVMRPPGNLDLIHESLFTKMDEDSNEKYANALIGKWHISSPVDYDHPMQHGVDHYEGLFTATVNDYYAWEKVVDASLTISNEYVTTDLTDAAINWIENQDQPWFLWLAHVAPHSPFHEPPSDLFTQTNTNGNLGKYLAAIEAMDSEIGRLLDSMDEATRENTVIIFIGDNGTPGNTIQNFSADHAKSSLYEGGIRVPMFISGKGVSRVNQKDNNLNHSADLYATILELTGSQFNGGVHNSMSLKPLLSSESKLNREYIYTDYDDGNAQAWAIRNMDYKLIEDENGNQEFYKVSTDILEENNLLANLTTQETEILLALQMEANIIRDGWSCTDGIQNGNELTLDDCDGILNSLSEVKASDIILSPNPSNGKFTIQLPTNNPVIVTITSIEGKIIQTLNGSNIIPVHNLTTGVYILQITSTEGKHIYKKHIVN